MGAPMFLLLLACLMSPSGYESLLAQAQDADGDGYGAVEFGGSDCDDTDPEVSPDAEDGCDGRDNDCDGGVDEGITIPIWYPDEDGDQFGVSEAGIAACDRPEGTVPQPGDCDDRDTKRNPAADEVCDGQDNDCDGLVDDADQLAEVPGQTWYVDADGDGYASDAAEPVGFCSAPAGYVEVLGDCDDSTRSVNPGVAEVCEDGIDNDCSGDAPECGFDGAYTLNRADLVLSPGGADFGSSFALVEVGEEQPWLFVGTSNKVFGFEPPFDGSKAIETWDVRLKNDGTGKQVVSLGDSNGDGVDELVSAYVEDGSLHATVSLFSSSEEGKWDESLTFGWKDMPDSSWGFGFELNRYGASGLLVGELGQVYLWESPPQSLGELVVPDARVSATEDQVVGFLNTTVSADLDGDGVDELVLGGLGVRVSVLKGPISGQIDTADADWAVNYGFTEDEAAFGGSPTASDLDGDGYPELLVTDMAYSVDFVDGGAVWVFPGFWASELTEQDALASVRGSEDDARLGRSVAAMDGNGDGYAEVVVSEAGTGDIYLFDVAIGYANWTTDDSVANVVGVTNGSCSAEFLVLDANQDGFDDLMTGCPDAGSGSLHVLLAPGM